MSDGGRSDDVVEQHQQHQEHAVPTPPLHVHHHVHDDTVYYSPPGSPPPPVYYYGSPPPGLGYYTYHPGHPALGAALPPAHPHPAAHQHVYYPPAQVHQYHYQHQMTQAPSQGELMVRAHSSDSISSMEGSSPTKRGEARATARISRSSRTKSATELQDELKFDPEAETLTRTTLMIRNIPNKYQAAEVMSLLKSVGLENTFDFLYVPLDFRNAANLGYAFLNMVDAELTRVLYQKFAGKRWDDRNSKKVCEVTYARVQGRTPLIEHFKNAKFPGKNTGSDVMSSDRKFLPLVWNKRKTVSGGSVVDGPPLTIFEFIAQREASLCATNQ